MLSVGRSRCSSIAAGLAIWSCLSLTSAESSLCAQDLQSVVDQYLATVTAIDGYDLQMSRTFTLSDGSQTKLVGRMARSANMLLDDHSMVTPANELNRTWRSIDAGIEYNALGSKDEASFRRVRKSRAASVTTFDTQSLDGVLGLAKWHGNMGIVEHVRSKEARLISVTGNSGRRIYEVEFGRISSFDRVTIELSVRFSEEHSGLPLEAIATVVADPDEARAEKFGTRVGLQTGFSVKEWKTCSLNGTEQLQLPSVVEWTLGTNSSERFEVSSISLNPSFARGAFVPQVASGTEITDATGPGLPKKTIYGAKAVLAEKLTAQASEATQRLSKETASARAVAHQSEGIGVFWKLSLIILSALLVYVSYRWVRPA
jgi:hypothetical protein